MATNSRQGALNLRQECLSFPEVLAQSVGNVAPTMTPAVNIGLVFASAGNGTWLAFLVATIGLVFVTLNINEFSRRSASTGSLYTYIARGLGSTIGVLSGWALVLAYLFTAMALLGVFANYMNLVLHEFGFQVNSILLFVFCAGIAWFYAYTDIQLSAVLMLVLEIASVSLIFILAGFVLVKHGFTIDTSQLLLEGVSYKGIRIGLVLAVFSFVGFESATTLGNEAKEPLRFIPRSVIWSIVISGLFYILLSYVEVIGFSGNKTPLDKSSVPLSDLASLTGVSFLGVIISVGIVSSSFTCILACINSGARIFFSMARHGIFPSSVGQVHVKNETPYVAVTLSIIIAFLVPASMSLFGISNLDIYGYLGTIATYGFLIVYILISVAAPVYLHRKGRLLTKNVAIAVISVIFMLIPVVGSIYPVPPAPYNILPYLFLMYLVVGSGWFLMLRLRSPHTVNNMERELESVQDKFSEPEVS